MVKIKGKLYDEILIISSCFTINEHYPLSVIYSSYYKPMEKGDRIVLSSFHLLQDAAEGFN